MIFNGHWRFLLLGCILAFTACVKHCDKSLLLGEEVQIPIAFVGFTLNEIDNIHVCRIDLSDSLLRDTFAMRNILWTQKAKTSNQNITDRAPAKKGIKQYGDYESYFDHCLLVFDWASGKDTLYDLQIKKSKANVKGCHSSDPNIQIDKVSFVHNGRLVSRNESIQIVK